MEKSIIAKVKKVVAPEEAKDIRTGPTFEIPLPDDDEKVFAV